MDRPRRQRGCQSHSLIYHVIYHRCVCECVVVGFRSLSYGGQVLRNPLLIECEFLLRFRRRLKERRAFLR